MDTSEYDWQKTVNRFPSATGYIAEDEDEDEEEEERRKNRARGRNVSPTDVKLLHVYLVAAEQLDTLCSFLVNMSASRFFTSSHAVVATLTPLLSISPYKKQNRSSNCVDDIYRTANVSST